MLAICDGANSCGKEFQLKKFEIEKLSKGIEKTYFICPHCNKEYVAFYTNYKIRQKQYRQRIASYPKNEKLRKEIKVEMNKLKLMMGTQ